MCGYGCFLALPSWPSKLLFLSLALEWHGLLSLLSICHLHEKVDFYFKTYLIFFLNLGELFKPSDCSELSKTVYDMLALV